MAKKPKRPPSPSSSPPRKEVPARPRRLQGLDDEPDGRKPSWRLSLLDLNHDGSWSWSVTETTVQKIATFLTQMERLTWTEILAQITSGKRRGHRKHHPVPVERLCPEAQRRLQDLQLDEFDELFRFRLGNRPRLWGIVDGAVFYPVWWGPRHKVYPLDPG